MRVRLGPIGILGAWDAEKSRKNEKFRNTLKFSGSLERSDMSSDPIGPSIVTSEYTFDS